MNPDKSTMETITVPELVKKVNQFAGALFGNLLENNSGENLVFSPYSVFTLLMLAADASAGKTQTEITHAVLNRLRFDPSLAALRDIQDQLMKETAFSSANAVIVRADKKDTVNPDYPDHLREIFNGELFAGENSVQTVNEWACRNSNGMIRNLADDSMKESLVCLLNACTFLAGWGKKYKDISVQYSDFHNGDGSVSRIAMLNSYERTYIENKFFIGFAKPYAGDAFSYIVLLPKNGMQFTKEALESIDYSCCLCGQTNTIAKVIMPEFQVSSDYDLIDICKKLGIRTIFTPQADFSPMTSDWLMAEAVRHKAHIKVDRAGTEAAAVAAMHMCVGGIPARFPEEKEVIVDRPFIYAIVHHDTGLPVFAGMVNCLESVKLRKEQEKPMTKETAIKLARECAENNGPILGIKEYDDIFVITFVKGWDTIIVNKSTGKAVWEQDLPEEEAIRIARRPFTPHYKP